METRVLRYFLAVVREENISKAAESLHITQPTLSRQIMDLEQELGKTLLIRGNKKIALTEEGVILRKRAEEIISLIDKTESEIILSDSGISGDIYIGAGETDTIRYVARAAKELQDKHPNVRYHIFSGDSEDVLEKLSGGILDFGLLFSDIDTAKYDCITIPVKDRWGVIMRRDAPLAEKEYITPQDLWNEPLIISRKITRESGIMKWFKRDISRLNIKATYNLIYNASMMTVEGLGYTIGLDKLIDTSKYSQLCFKPLSPTMESDLNMVWKKYSVMSKPAEAFLETFKHLLTEID